MEPYTYEEAQEILKKAKSASSKLKEQKEWDQLIDFEKVYPILEEKYFATGDEDIDITNELLRTTAATLLSYDWSERSKEILINTLDDDDEVLVAEATEALYWSDDDEVLAKLYSLAKNGETEIIRNYAIMFIPKIFWNIYYIDDKKKLEILKDMLHKLFEAEEETYVKITIANELYIHEEREEFDYILSELYNEDSYVRGFVIEFIQKNLDIKNIDKVQKVIREVYKNETVPDYKKRMVAILLFQKEML